MKKTYVKPEVTKVELEEKHSVMMVAGNCKTGDIPDVMGVPFDPAAWPCLEETSFPATGSYFALGAAGTRPKTVLGGNKESFTIVDS